MLNALRLLRAQPESTVLSLPSPYYTIGKRFRQAVAGSPQSSDKMAQANDKPNLELGDPLSSLGEEYATRCEEEGFGGVYGEKNKTSKEDEEEEYRNPAKAPPAGKEMKDKEKDENKGKVA